VQGVADDRGEELAGLRIGQAVHGQRRELLEQPWRRRLADRGDHADAVGVQAPGHEADHLRRFGIEPLGVVDEAQQRLLLARARKNRQHGEPHQEPVRRRPSGQPERDLQREPLGRRQGREHRQERDQQLVHAPELQADFRLDPGHGGNPQIGSRMEGVLQQRRLPGAGTSAQHHRLAEAATRGVQHAVDGLPLQLPVKQDGSPLVPATGLQPPGPPQGRLGQAGCGRRIAAATGHGSQLPARASQAGPDRQLTGLSSLSPRLPGSANPGARSR